MSQPPQPIIVGALRKTPLAEFLIQAYDGGFEGTLLLQTAERHKSAVWFARGAPAKARLFDRSITLSSVVVDLGLVTSELAVSSQKQAAEQKRLHGEVMVEHGYIDRTGLYLGLREQLTRQMLALCQLPDTTDYGFYRENLLESWGHEGQWRVKPLRIVWRAAVDHLPAARRAAWLRKLGDTPLRLRVDAPVSRYGLTKRESSVVDMMRVKPGTMAELLESGVGDENTIHRVVCGLLLTRQLDLGFKQDPVGLHEPPETPQSVPPPETRAARRGITVPRPSSIPAETGEVSVPRDASHSSSAPQAPGESPQVRRSTPARPITASSSPRNSITAPAPTVRVSEAPEPEAPSREVQEFSAEIQKYQDAPPRNYYELLGIETNADSARVRSAFFQLARRWHPDKLPAELSHLRAVVNQAFSEMGEAHQTLMDDAKRAEYDRGLSEAPDEEQEQVANILRAASAHQRAEILYKKKSYREALTESKTAYEIDPGQPDHVALYAWLHTLVHPNEDHQPQLEMISKALEANPDHVRALWYRGQLYKKMNLTAKAMRDFKHIVDVKPNHVDAAREVRVYKMRRQTDPKSAASSPRPSGLFGAFRKKS